MIGCLYIAMGAIGFAYHFTELLAGGAFHSDVLWVELIRVAAMVFGAFLLRGHNWARWAALGWMAFHVVVGAFHDWLQFALHGVFLVLIAWLLFRPAAARYFCERRAGLAARGEAAGR
jgi:hypothetical protein